MKLLNLSCLLLLFLNPSSSVNIDCTFSGHYYTLMNTVHSCIVKNVLNLDSPQNTLIDSISGAQVAGKTNDDVIGFHVQGKNVHYFPKGLEKFFKNLITIHVWEGRLKEIHQSDLKPLVKLQHFNCYSNDIEILEEGLFDYNPDLIIIGFENNKIFHVHTDVFSNVKKLVWLNIGTNKCISTKAENNQYLVGQIIQNIRSQCSSPEFTKLNEKFKNLQNESKALSSEVFKEKLDSFESEFKKSKFVNFLPLSKNFEELKGQVVKKDSKIENGTSLDITVLQPLDSDNKDSQVCQKCCGIDDFSKNLATFAENFEASKSSIENLKVQINGSALISEEKFLAADVKLMTIDKKLTKIDEIFDKMTILEGKFGYFKEFELKVTKKLSKMEAEFNSMRYKMSSAIDSKLCKIESQIKENMEELFEDMYVKIVNTLKVED